MAHTTMNQYLQQIDEALQQGRGKKAAELLSCKHAHSASSRLHVEDPEPVVQRVMDTPWDEVVCQHLRCLYYMNNYNFVDAYKEQAVLVQLFTKIFQSLKEENWALPIMYTVCLDLRLFASQADMQLSKKSKGKPGETLEKAAEFLMGCFRVCASDNRSSLENSKRRGMLNLVNQLFKIYFKINKLHLCKPLIRAIESSALKDHFSISQLVTYRYYVGQKAMFDSDFKNAEEYLTFAFLRCDKDSVHNKRLILIYLIPVKMLLMEHQMIKWSHAKRGPTAQVRPDAVCRGGVRRHGGQPDAFRQSAGSQRGLLHQEWYLPHPGAAQGHHIPEPVQKSVSAAEDTPDSCGGVPGGNEVHEGRRSGHG
ncbi:PCI domain-containing protein 2 isoform X2 [Dermacentor andersoni]|uniref:PCI domain-containing protein 2 isoform X2 n=1 Tax=Dermacentor andersoni TaxID=34620 RepID=UPI002417834B|nr:PCI domain-containing protein 2-like isoform X2 [Dermacentor andersoni]